MKKYALWILLAVLFCAVTYGGCGGSGGTSGTTINPSTLKAAYSAKSNDVLTGTLGSNVKISIANGAVVTLRSVTINGVDAANYTWAGITCKGSATIILEGANTVRGFRYYYPGISVPANSTLTIRGEGSLTVSSNSSANTAMGAGIGGGYNIPCGNIVIDSGTVTASCKDTISGNAAGIGSGSGSACGDITINDGNVTATGIRYGAGIGSSSEGTCGNIEINGGTVKATGGRYGAGIGTSSVSGSCGDITISDAVIEVTAVKGSDAVNSIGGYNDSSCGTITIGGEDTGAISESPFVY